MTLVAGERLEKAESIFVTTRRRSTEESNQSRSVRPSITYLDQYIPFISSSIVAEHCVAISKKTETETRNTTPDLTPLQCTSRCPIADDDLRHGSFILSSYPRFSTVRFRPTQLDFFARLQIHHPNGFLPLRCHPFNPHNTKLCGVDVFPVESVIISNQF